MKKKKNVMMCIILCLICIILLLSKTTQANKTDTYDVILFWGQSNMVGLMSSGNEKFDNEIVEDVEKFSKITKIDKDILYNTSSLDYVKIKQEDGTVFEYKYSSNSLEEVSENTKIFGEYLYYNDSLISLEQSRGLNSIPEFSRRYYELTGHKVIAVMAALGGQPIGAWLPNGDIDHSVTDPNNQGYVYEMLVKKYNAAITYLEEKNYKIGNKLYMVVHGETNVHTQTTRDDYKKMFLKVHNNLKKDLGITGGAIVYTADVIGNRYNLLQPIHFAQEDLVRENSDIILGSSYLYDRYIPEKSIYESSSYINNNYIDDFGNKLGYDEAYNYATYNVCTPDNAIYFTSATLTQVGRDVAERLSNFGYYSSSLESGDKTSFDVSMIFSDLTSFNRYTLKYDSDVYIKGTITYRINGVIEKERFFLEPNDNGVFSSFINGYIDGRSIKKEDIISIDFENISENDGKLNIYYFDLVSFSDVNDLINNINGDLGESDYIEQQTLFIGNDNIKLGISLRYGGSINYISGDGEIFTDNYANINLINSRDNGRFIQQCYYGNNLYNNDEPYVSGACDNIAGIYNPIQGGYVSGACDDGESLGAVHSSKIVDIGINSEKNNITIITKPSLWALTNEQYKNDYYDYYGGFTADAYMITQYTIYDTYISVSNSYIDFTDNVGNGNSARSESPSVYTISALSEFYAYSRKSDIIRKYEIGEINSSGLKPFINDEEFKSDGSYENAVWSPWGGFFSTNDGVTEGLGIYRPDYDGSYQYLHGFVAGNADDKSSFGSSTSFFTSIIHLAGKLSKFKKFSYDYVVTLGNINNIHTIMNNYRNDHSYTLSIDPNDGIYNSSSNITRFNPDLMAYWGNWCTIGVASRKGYDLVGYYDSPTGGNIVYDSSGIAVNSIYWKVNADELVTANSVENKYQYIGLKDLTVYARWEPVDYKITYDLDGGSVTGNPSSYTAESDEIILKNPTKNGYKFLGWTGTGLNSVTSNVTILKGSTGDRNYVATWIKDVEKYIVTYDANGGSIENTKFEVVYGNFYGDLLIPKKNGYKFLGWYLDNTTFNDKIEDTTIVDIDSNHTLYAKWELLPFNIEDTSDYIINGNLIGNIISGTKVNELKLGLDNSYIINVYNSNDIKKTEGILFTGDKIKIYLDDVLICDYILVIRGDVNGDGVVGINDIIKLSKHYLDYDILTKDEYIYAGDFNVDKKIDINDIIKLSKYIIYEK